MEKIVIILACCIILGCTAKQPGMGRPRNLPNLPGRPGIPQKQHPPWGSFGNPEAKFLYHVQFGRYNTGNPPVGVNGDPVEVNAKMYVSRLMLNHNGSSTFRQPTVWAEVYLHYQWVDIKLEHSADTKLPTELFDKIWTPDLHFGEAIDTTITKYPAVTKYIKIFSNGTVLQSQRLQITLVCTNMSSELHDDEKIHCPLSLEAYGNTDNKMRIASFNVYHSINEPISIRHHNLVSVDKDTDCTATYVTGTFSCRRVAFNFTYKGKPGIK